MVLQRLIREYEGNAPKSLLPVLKSLLLKRKHKGWVREADTLSRMLRALETPMETDIEKLITTMAKFERDGFLEKMKLSNTGVELFRLAFDRTLGIYNPSVMNPKRITPQTAMGRLEKMVTGAAYARISLDKAQIAFFRQSREVEMNVSNQLTGKTAADLESNMGAICKTLMTNAYDLSRPPPYFPDGIACAWGMRKKLMLALHDKELHYTWAIEQMMSREEVKCLASTHVVAI
jgi:hypothetical protein